MLTKMRWTAAPMDPGRLRSRLCPFCPARAGAYAHRAAVHAIADHCRAGAAGDGNAAAQRHADPAADRYASPDRYAAAD